MEERIIVHNTSDPAVASDELLRKTLVKDDMITLPVDVEDIARQLNIEVRRLPLDVGTDGLLVKDEEGDGFKAVVDAYAHTHRARFTLAHEIGHYIKDYQFADGLVGVVERRDNMSSTGRDPNEVWANRFAAALLMPAGVVASLWAEGLSEEEIADIFNVSQDSFGHRLDGLGLR